MRATNRNESYAFVYLPYSVKTASSAYHFTRYRAIQGIESRVIGLLAMEWTSSSAMRRSVSGKSIDEAMDGESEAVVPAPPPPVDTLPSRSDRQRVDSLIRAVLQEYGTPASLVPDLPTPSASR